MPVIKIESKAQLDDIISKNAKVAIDFTASWCGPCGMIGPVFEQLSDQHDDIVFVKVDVDEQSDISSAYKVRAMPTFKFIKNGSESGELVGASKDKLTAKLVELKN